MRFRPHHAPAWTIRGIASAGHGSKPRPRRRRSRYHHERLREIGIDPLNALMELHVKNKNQQILSEIDAYILLMSKVQLLKPLAWLIGLPLIRPMLSKVYHWQVNRRLQHSGRL